MKQIRFCIAFFALTFSIVIGGCVAPIQQPPPMYAIGGIGGVDGGLYASTVWSAGTTCAFPWPADQIYVIENDFPIDSRRFVAPADSAAWQVFPCDVHRLVEGMIPPGRVQVRYYTRRLGRNVDSSIEGYTWFLGDFTPTHTCVVPRSSELPFPYTKPWLQRVNGHCQPLAS